MPRRRRASGLALAARILPLLVTACQRGTPAEEGLTVTDSSGVHIIESSRSDGDEAWQVPDAPVFRIGGPTGGLHFALNDVGLLRPDGSSVVGDLGYGTIYLISASGDILSTLRGEGDGPGEMLDPAAIIGLGGDTIVVHNATNVRVETFVGDRLVRDVEFSNTFGETGDGLVRDVEFSKLLGETDYTVFGRTGDGRFLLNPTGFSDSAFEGTVGWRDWPILRTGTDFSAVDTVAFVPIIQVKPPGDHNPIRQFGEPIWTGHRIAYAATDRAEVRWLPLDGSNIRVVRWVATVGEADEELWREYEAKYREEHTYVGSSTWEQRMAEQRLAEARRDFGGPLPFFRSAHADLQEDVWLQDYRVTRAPADSYLVVTPEGGLHRVRFPAPIQILDIADTLVLGVEENELEEQALVLYRVEKSR